MCFYYKARHLEEVRTNMDSCTLARKEYVAEKKCKMTYSISGIVSGSSSVGFFNIIMKDNYGNVAVFMLLFKRYMKSFASIYCLSY